MTLEQRKEERAGASTGAPFDFEKGFAFRQHTQIKINGKLYECDVTNNDLLRGVAQGWPKVLRASARYLAVREKLKESTAQSSAIEMQKANEAMLRACQEFLYGCIGRAEYAEIFAGRRPNSADHLELAHYIYRWITEGRKTYQESFMDVTEEGGADDAEGTANADHGAQDPNGRPVVDALRGLRARFAAFWSGKNRDYPG